MQAQVIQQPSKGSALLGMYLLPKGIGLLLSLEMIQLWPDLELLYSHHLLSASHIQQYQLPWSMFIINTDLTYVFAALYILSGLFMCFHSYTFFPTLSLFILHYSFFVGNSVWSYGVDYLAQTGLFFSLMFGGRPKCLQKSLELKNLGTIFFRLQLTVVYFFAGLGKAFGETWWNGEAVWKAIHQPIGDSYFSVPLAAYRYEYLWILLGIITILLELSYPLAWIKKTFRPLIINGIILVHIGIALSMGLLHFALLMIWYNLCAWDHPLLNIAKPNIKPLERSKPKLQVPIATETINTTKGGTK